MEIVSIYYAVLIIISVFIYYIIRPKYRILFLTILSVGFIASLSINLLLYVISFAAINFVIGARIPISPHKTALFRCGISLNIIQLFLFKYYHFTIAPLFHLFKVDLNLSHLSGIIIPIGISYFTLQGIGYLVNIKMGWEKPESRMMHFLLYIIFFPKFVSGPIERSDHLLPQFKGTLDFNAAQIESGMLIILRGFFKKVIIANNLAITINYVYSNTDLTGGLNVLLIILIQPLYLYFDFSGYTDMAIGVAKTFGISLLPNFNRPFTAVNVTTFWRKFHMSLAFWFNDYIFKQVSFRLRRWKSHATTIAVFLTWILFGVWHGAGWNFMMLGFIQAIAIFYEFKSKRARTIMFSRLPWWLGRSLGRVITYCFYGFSLIFFFSANLPNSFELLGKLGNLKDFSTDGFLWKSVLFSSFFAILFLFHDKIQTDNATLYTRLCHYWNKYSVVRKIVYFLASLLVLSQLNGSASFVYEMF